MLFTSSERIFDTLIDTHPKRVTMIKTSFYLRRDVKVQGTHPIYLHVSGSAQKRERFPLDLYVEEKYWDSGNGKIIIFNHELKDKQLILDNIRCKVINIITVYRLSNLLLTPEILRAEYENKISRVNFIAFFIAALNEEKSKMCIGTYNRHHSVYLKLKKFNSNVSFNEISLSWMNKYRNYLKEHHGNLETTVNANFASIKKFLRLAQKNGIKLLFDIEDLKIGDTKGNRTYLNEKEVSSLLEYYFSSFIKPSWRLVLGYFLFSCMNGLRISNVQRINRHELLDNDFSVIMVKGNKNRNLGMNETLKKIINAEELLFVEKFTDQHINEELKKIMITVGIKKKVTFHVARHTFATLFLKAGGKPEYLQNILGHSDITQTMIYVHIVQSDANNEMFLLDKIFNFKAVN